MKKTHVSNMALWSALFVSSFLVQSIVCPAIPGSHVDDNKIDTGGDHKKEKSKVDQELDDLVSDRQSAFDGQAFDYLTSNVFVHPYTGPRIWKVSTRSGSSAGRG